MLMVEDRLSAKVASLDVCSLSGLGIGAEWGGKG